AAATPQTRAPAGPEEQTQAEPDTLRILRGGVPHDVVVYPLEVPDRSAEALRGWLVMDISTAQEVLGTGDRLSRIDVLIESSADTLGLSRTVGTLAVLEPATNRSATLSQMTRAFELNLQALSLLAMVVGMFIIYNTTMFSVVQRRSVIGRLRALGLTQRELSRHVGLEVFFIGAVGTGLGVLLGLALGQGMVRLVARTINDLYFVTEVEGVSVDPLVLFKGGLVGLASTLAAAWGPIRQAVTQPVSVVLQRSSDEARYGKQTTRYAIMGVLALLAGFLLIMSSRASIVVAYLGLLGLLLGWSLCVPRMIQAVTFLVRRLLGKSGWLTLRMATEGVSASLSRTSVATAALMVAISATIGVGVMVQSFRGTVGTWLEQSLQADIYIQPPAEVFRRVYAHIDSSLYDDLTALDGVDEAYGVLRSRVVDVSGTSHDLAVVDLPGGRSETILLTEAPNRAFWDGFTGEDHLIISEPMAFRSGLA
ncbi:MAG: FtsX-like permease family protein, partial [Bacteroidetes bacterium]|nr:FtsX-like permease family protein [Bacteroidota bacterium]